MKTLHTLLAMTFSCSMLPAAFAQGGGVPPSGPNPTRCGETVCEQIVVQLQPNESIEPINSAFGTTTVRSIPQRGVFLLQVPPNASTQIMQNALVGDPRVAWAELNHVMVAPNGGTQSFFLSATFNDYVRQEHLAVIQADRLRFADSRTLTVAVLDTGVDPDHNVFANRLAPGGYNYIGDNADYRDIGNGLDDNGNGQIDEMVGHGTMVSGLILRIAPQARILPMRVLNCDGVGASFYVAQAIYDSIDLGAGVINISLGSIRPSQAIADAVQAALDHGIIIVAAAGNTDRSEPAFYPAAFEGVLSVAGTTTTDRKAEFSDYGQWIDLTAPAVDLASAFPGTNGNTYARNSGTSMAAPLVTGAAVLVRLQQPSLTPAQVGATLKMTSTSIDPLNPEYAGLLGSGRLNIRQALTAPTGSRPRP
jgi:subtilisin family serine protease